MSAADAIRVLGADFPVCAHLGCRMHALDGYCEASCCVGTGRAYCSNHSHRPTALLEILGHGPLKQSFTRQEVEDLLKSCWVGAGMVFESAGYLKMIRDVEAKRRADGSPYQTPDGIRRD